MKTNLPVVKRYKHAFEAKDSTNQLNPFTVIRHRLYLSDKQTFSKPAEQVGEGVVRNLAQDE